MGIGRDEARHLLIKGMLIINLFLVPIAAAGLYLAFLGRQNGDAALTFSGALLALLSPVLGYLAALPLLRRMTPETQHEG